MESSNSGILEPNYEEKFNIPSQFQIIEYAYTKKDISKKGVCYRCQNRNKCSLTLVIEIKEFKKILNKTNTEDISYKINSRQKVHTSVIEEIKKVKITEYMTIDEIKFLAKNLVN